jgi:hypothetical protein
LGKVDVLIFGLPSSEILMEQQARAQLLEQPKFLAVVVVQDVAAAPGFWVQVPVVQPESRWRLPEPHPRETPVVLVVEELEAVVAVVARRQPAQLEVPLIQGTAVLEEPARLPRSTVLLTLLVALVGHPALQTPRAQAEHRRIQVMVELVEVRQTILLPARAVALLVVRASLSSHMRPQTIITSPSMEQHSTQI